MEFIIKSGIDIMVETARYWIERVDINKRGYYELLSVMGPDEYLPTTRNNSFTNRMVKFSLAKTAEFLQRIKQEDKKSFSKIEKRLDIRPDEIEKFKQVGENLILLYDQNTDIVPQSEDFESYADIDFNAIWKDRTKPFGSFISQEKNYRSKALKQADVLELMLLYPEDFTQKQLIKAYDYYEPITTHDSSLSASVHGILAAWMDRMEEAERFLKKVMETDMALEKKGAAEGIHIANCGGLWQMIIYGFAGLRSAMWCDEIELRPHLPKNWEKLEFNLEWQGKLYKITVTKEKHEVLELYQ
jgi:kojibiose phosphorylase